MDAEIKSMVKHTVINSPHCDKDCEFFYSQLHDTFSWFNELDLPRKVALIALCFLIGWKNVMALSNLLLFLSKSNFMMAAEELIKSGYDNIGHIIRSGELPKVS